MSAATTTAVADCELLGRGPVQGSADSDSLAALVRQLCKQQQRARLPGRRCAVSCSRDAGLEIVPHHRAHRRDARRPDDEGFESDEDLASLGSYEDPGKRKPTGGAGTGTGTGGGGGGGGGGGAGVGAGGPPSVTSVAASAGVASDSANSSGVSEDSDDADAASLRDRPSDGGAGGPGSAGGDGRETYGLTDVAFCHTDATALPGVAVWVIKTRRAPHAAGLEAIVFRCRDGRLQDVCRAYQEHSRRLKLEPKPWAAQAGQAAAQSHRRKAAGAGAGAAHAAGGGTVNLTAVPEVNRFSLVQRTDTDGVTHIEVTAGPVAAGGSPDYHAPSSSIISLSTPESPRLASRDDRDLRDRDRAAVALDGECPPQRPERRKHKPRTEADADDGGGVADDSRRQQKVVRGQFIRVNVNHHAAVLRPDSPEPERACGGKREQPAAAKPAVVDRLWSTADYDRLDGRYEQHHRSSSRAVGSRTRSRSTGPGRRLQYPLHLTAVSAGTTASAVQQQHPPPVVAAPFSRYQSAADHQQSFGTRFFGKLREITSGAGNPHDLQPVTFRRRNSVGESAATANFHQYFSHHHHQHLRHGGHDPQYQQQQQYQQHQQQQQYQQHNRQQAKSCGNLKSVIKKNNKSQPYQHAFDEPKKVTFSAYATVQVVD